MRNRERRSVQLSGCRMDYVDSGCGPTLVLLHGALMDEHLWLPVVDALDGRARCVVPILPLGSHVHPVPATTDMSPTGVAEAIVELIDTLDLGDVILVGNDTGGALAQLVAAGHPGRIAGLVLVSCDAFDNFPPGLPGRTMALASAVPGMLRMALASLRFRPLRRLPMTFGWMTKRPIPDAVLSRWLEAFDADRGVRQDVRRFMAGVDRVQLVRAAAELEAFDRPALVVWAAEDRVMPRAHAERLATLLPRGRLEWVSDSYTLIPLDQPTALADLLAEFSADLPRA